MAYGYLGELNNRNLDSLISGEGFYEVNNPEIVSSFNNYPDDSHILYKLLFQHEDLNRKYKIYTGTEDKITPEILEELKTRHKAVYDHLSGAGSKVIRGILEIRNFEETDINRPEIIYQHIRGDIRYQRFYRFNDNVSFIRYWNGYQWTEWFYLYTSNTEYLILAEDVITLKNSDILKRAFQHYAPPYDDTRLKAEIEKKTDIDEFNKKLKYKDSEPSGVFTLTGGVPTRQQETDYTLMNHVETTQGPLILDTRGHRDGTGSFVHGRTPEGFYLQLFRLYDGMSLGVGHNNYSRVLLETSITRGAVEVYPTNIFWNDINNRDLEIQHLGRFQFSRLSGRWPTNDGERRSWNVALDDFEEIMVTHSKATNYGTSAGTFIWPTCTRENVQLYACNHDPAYDPSNINADIDAFTGLAFDGDRSVTIQCTRGMRYQAYGR